MKITPLVIAAGLSVPKHTSLFSDTLSVSSITVTQGGNVVITTPTAHGVPVGQAIAISITDADTPNAITGATVDADGNVVLTTQYAHRLTTTPNAELFDQWSLLAKISGFTDPLINGNRQIVDVPDRNTVVITPGGEVLSVVLNGNEVLLERLELEIIGWHKVTAASTTTLTFPTPATVDRSYTVANPTVVRNIRIYGALNYENALEHFTPDDPDAQALDKPCMFVLPSPVDVEGGKAYLTQGADNRFILRDGFTVLVLIPSHSTSAHVGAIDLAQGTIFRAVMRSFHGLKVPRSEFECPGDYMIAFEGHNGARASRNNRAIYAHEYIFSVPAEITSADGISPFDWPADSFDDQGLVDGTVPDSIYPAQPPPWRDLDVTGIYRFGHPSPMTGTATINSEE